jgi:hypothetical protein
VVDPETNEPQETAPVAHTSWLRPDRPARLNEKRVEPDETGSFTFIIQAPDTPGTYDIRVRPLVALDTPWWMEAADMPVTWRMTVNEPPPDQPRFLLLPPYTTASVDQTFGITLTASLPVSNADTVLTYLTFDPAALAVVDAAGNPTSTVALSRTLFPTATVNVVNNQDGLIDIEAVSSELSTISGTLHLATIHFRLKAADGPVTINFSRDPERRSDVLRRGESLNATQQSGSAVIVPRAAPARKIFLPVVMR